MTRYLSRKKNSGLCKVCGVYRTSLHRDHIIPRYKGGSDDVDNIQWLCANCHEDKTVEDCKGWQHYRPRETWNKGKKLSPEIRQRMSVGNLGEKNGFYGKKHSEEARAKMRETKRQRRITRETLKLGGKIL